MEEILDDEEKEYLKAVIKPFKNKISYIKKESSLNRNFEYIKFSTENDYTILPKFKFGTMYKNMKNNKAYTLEDLGLDE